MARKARGGFRGQSCGGPGFHCIPSGRLLYAAVTKTANLSEIRDALAAQAIAVTTSTPGEFRKLAREELSKYGKVVKAIGLKVE